MVFLNPVKTLLFSLIFCIAIFLLHYQYVGSIVWGDGKYYYTTARSLAIDQDFDFDNEYRNLSIYEPFSDTGFRVNKYAPGTSLVFLPVMFTIGVFDCATTSSPCSQIGYSALYQISVGVTNIVLVFIGLYFVFLALSKYHTKTTSLYAVLSILFATNLLFYASFDPINSHPVSFFFSSLLLYVLLVHKNTFLKWMILGIILGWSTLTRTMDVLLCIPIVYFALRENKEVGKKLRSLASIGIMFLLFFSIQIFFWQTIYGSIQSPYLSGNEGFAFSSPHLLEVLFNKDTGIVIWTPFVFLGFIALFKIKEYFKWIWIVTILTAFYFISSWSSWDQGGSFGNRMLITYLPFISFGFAYIFDKKKWNRFLNVSPVSIIIAAGIINTGFILTYLSTH